MWKIKTEQEIRKEIARICNLAYERGMVCGSGGNISARIGDKIFITPSGYSLGSIKADDIVEVTIDGKVSGNIRPSTELSLHMKAYETRPDINGIIHVHSLYTTIVGIMAGEKEKEVPMPPYTPSYALKAKNIKTVPFYVPGTIELAESVATLLKITDIILMKNHGIVVVAKNLENAFNIVEEVEQNAKMHTILMGKGCLTPWQVSEILKKYK